MIRTYSLHCKRHRRDSNTDYILQGYLANNCANHLRHSAIITMHLGLEPRRRYRPTVFRTVSSSSQICTMDTEGRNRTSGNHFIRMTPSPLGYFRKNVNRAGWIRTSVCRSQSPVPYRLATALLCK